MNAERATTPEKALAATVAIDGEQRPFGELTVDEIERHGAALSEAAGMGHGNRVGAVAVAWTLLAKTMRERGHATVADLAPAEAADQAERLWIIPPGGSLLG